MAISTEKYAGTSDFSGFLDPKKSAPIFEEMQRKSLIQQLGKRVEMGPTGVEVPFWKGDVKASWVSEAGKKPLTKGGYDKFTIKPHKIAAIFAMSAEVVRANPNNYINTMRQKVAEAFAIALDDAALHGTSTPFGNYVDETTKSVALTGAGTNAYDAFNNGLSLLVKDNKKWTGGLLDLEAEPIINGAKDKSDRPLFLEPTYTETDSIIRNGRVLSRPVFIADEVKSGTTLGYMGDFSQVFWGQVGGISYDVSDQATLDLSEAQDGTGLTSLWQHNLVAVRCEAEFGLRVHDKDAFVKITES